jgi:hypothetical protein
MPILFCFLCFGLLNVITFGEVLHLSQLFLDELPAVKFMQDYSIVQAKCFCSNGTALHCLAAGEI